MGGASMYIRGWAGELSTRDASRRQGDSPIDPLRARSRNGSRNRSRGSRSRTLVHAHAHARSRSRSRALPIASSARHVALRDKSQSATSASPENERASERENQRNRAREHERKGGERGCAAALIDIDPTPGFSSSQALRTTEHRRDTHPACHIRIRTRCPYSPGSLCGYRDRTRTRTRPRAPRHLLLPAWPWAPATKYCIHDARGPGLELVVVPVSTPLPERRPPSHATRDTRLAAPR